jgi:Icc protein
LFRSKSIAISKTSGFSKEPFGKAAFLSISLARSWFRASALSSPNHFGTCGKVRSMPIHLPPISRRRFLARVAVVGSGLACAPELIAAAKGRDPNLWALFSDPHVAADREFETRGVNMTRHFGVASRELLDLPRKPAGLFVNGDCAYNSGLPGDYGLFSELLEPIRSAGVPVHLALGNHDDRSHFWSAFQQEKAARHPVAERQVSLLKTPHANWFILDSLEKTLSTPGLLGEEQLKWLASALDENREKPALVLVHHNPALEGGNMGLKDTARFLEIIRPRKQVKAYIYGHTHSWEVQQDSSGIHFINLPAVAYVFRKGDPSGWVIATVEKNAMRLELRCIDPKHPKQGQKLDLKWRT